jgi:hypothetical protein
MYRDLIIDFGNQNHWHNGVFLGFDFYRHGTTGERQTGQFLGVNLAGWPGDGMVFFSSARRLGDPTADLATELSSLWGEFLGDFEVDSAHVYHGVRHPYTGLTRGERESVANTATDLMYEGIWWTWANMLDWKGTGWNGSINDIDNLRCDGVIEYAYERNGLRVCGGKDSSLWNIGAGRKKHPKNHNDLHNFGYNQGELCAKIQAGNQGSDTTFITPAPTRPLIRAFQVSTRPAMTGSDMPTKYIIPVEFTVDCAEYDTVFVRLLVRPSGGTFAFLSTRQTYGWGGLEGTWWGKEVAQGTSHVAYWEGWRDPGSDLFGQNADFEFRIVAVDRGGNVSDTCETSLSIDWSTIVPPRW